MIVIATDGDPLTDVLHGYARTLIAGLHGQVTTWLGGWQATAKAIVYALETHPGKSVFLFGHGVPPPGAGFRGACGKIVLDVPRIPWFLADRVVVGSFCDGQQLGAHARQIGFSMFGYRGRLAVPLWPRYAAQMEEAALAGPLHVAQGGLGRGSRQDVLAVVCPRGTSLELLWPLERFHGGGGDRKQ